MPPIDDGWLRLSLLQHFAYCPRQAQLTLDGVWEDNALTRQGTVAHVRVDTGPTDFRRGLTVYHSVDLASERLQVFGVADSVEQDADGNLCPVEHKHGRGAGDLRPSTVHVVAQALCLEEMTGRAVEQAAIFVTSEHRRVAIQVSEHRDETQRLIEEARAVLLGEAPAHVHPTIRLCKSCSLHQACQPELNWQDS